MILIQDRFERPRGCGYRKAGGLYLVGGVGRGCGKLPFGLESCPACGGGVRFGRGWRWVDAGELLKNRVGMCGPTEATSWECYTCPLAFPIRMGRAGLLWVGEKFYPTVGGFIREGVERGISKRIAHVPVGFEAGKTWVLLAHRKARNVPCPCTCGARTSHAPQRAGDECVCDLCERTGWVDVSGIFGVFRPEAIEYVVRGDETGGKLLRLDLAGVKLVRVHELGADGQMHIQPGDGEAVPL